MPRFSNAVGDFACCCSYLLCMTCRCFGGLLWRREVQPIWKIRLTPKGVAPNTLFWKLLPGFHNPHRHPGHLWKKLELPLHSQDVSSHDSALPILMFGAAETGQWSVCIEHWYASEISKSTNRRNLQSPTNAWIKPKARHHSPPVGISHIYTDIWVISLTKLHIWQWATT